MAKCTQQIGNWIQHPCGGDVVGGFCTRCGADQRKTPTPASSGLSDDDTLFSQEELRMLEVAMAGDGANPSEWGVDPFGDFT